MEQLVRDFFADYGYIALFALLLLDNVGVPLPSEIPLLLAGVGVNDGTMDYVPAVIVAALGSLVGSVIAYAIGRTAGRVVALKFGKWVLVSPEDIDRAEAWFQRRGDAAVFVCRMIPLARTFISIPAGILEMPLLRFSVYTLAGSALWCLAVIGAGWGLGHNYERISGSFSMVGMIVASLVVMGAVIWFIRRRTAAKAREDARASAAERAEP